MADRYVSYVPVAPNMVNAPELRVGLMSLLMAFVHAEGYRLVPATEIDIADVTPAEGQRVPWGPSGYRMFRVAADVERQRIR